MTPKNTICLWFDKDALEAARFYAATFPDSRVTAVSFEHGGTEVHMRKKLGLERRKCASALLCRDSVR